jgi:hypothetical protein
VFTGCCDVPCCCLVYSLLLHYFCRMKIFLMGSMDVNECVPDVSICMGGWMELYKFLWDMTFSGVA